MTDIAEKIDKIDGRKLPGRGPKIHCKDCGSLAKIRSSEPVSSTLRKIYYECTNLPCGHAWSAHLSYFGTIRKSALTKDPPVKPVPPP